MAERAPATKAFAERMAAARAALRGGAVLVAVSPAAAERLRAGMPAERALLRERAPGELPELVLLPPGEPPRTVGWSPVRERKRRG